MSLPVQATEMDVPQSLAGANTLNAEALITLAQNINDLIVIDNRLAGDRDLGFIGESYNLPDVNTNCMTLAQINSDRKRNMVFYSNGVKCDRSITALKKAQQCGYKQLYWFRGGFEEWREKDYSYLLD
jgi:rhodanese-related sulfurtransferase